MTPDQIKIQNLENQVAELVSNQRLLMTLFRDSSFTRLALHNVIAMDKEAKFGVFGADPVSKITGLTLITHTAPSTPDYALQDLTNVAPYGFATKDEGNTLLSVVKNIQQALKSLGITT